MILKCESCIESWIFPTFFDWLLFIPGPRPLIIKSENQVLCQGHWLKVHILWQSLFNLLPSVCLSCLSIGNTPPSLIFADSLTHYCLSVRPSRYTKTKISSTTAVYAIVLDWPSSGILRLGAPSMDGSGVVYLLGYQQQVKFTPQTSGGVAIQLPVFTEGRMPCKHAWVFRLLGVKN